MRARKAAEEAVGEEIADRLQALQSRHAQSISGLEARVQRSERALESLNDLVAELSARTPALLKPAVAKREASAGSLRLNEASFEDLRACELSVTQAGRVLARREALGGYTALEQLDELPGLPAETLKAFKARISL